MFFSNKNDLEITEDNFQAHQDEVRFVVRDPQNDSQLISDFSLKGIDMNMTMTSEPKLAMISNHMNYLRFADQDINEQGSEYLDIREIIMDNSQVFGEGGDIANWIGNYFGDKRKQLGADHQNGDEYVKKNPLVFFQEMEAKFTESMLFYGASFDFIYLGRPQDWTQ